MKFTDYCSACLITAVKMYSLSTIGSELLQYLRFQWMSSEDLKARFCYECAALLRKFEQFEQKCRRAQGVLLKLRQSSHEITKMHIEKIDRLQHNLVSPITRTKCVTVTHNDELDLDGFVEIPVTSERKPILLKNNVNSLNNEPGLSGNKPSLTSNKGTLLKTTLIDETDFDLADYEMTDDKEDSSDTCDKQLDNGDDNYEFSDSTSESSIDDTQKTSTGIVKYKKKNKKLEKYIVENLSEVDDDPFSSEVTKMIEEFQETVAKRPKKTKVFKLQFFEKYMTVAFLSPEQAKNEILLRKETHINSPFKCDICYNGYETDIAFENHMKKHSPERGEYECELCHMWFSKRRQHGAHVLSWHKRKFSCKLCSYVGFDSDRARAHIVALHQDKNYPCKDCGEIFSSPESLLKHKRDKHLTEYVCDLCGNSFPVLPELVGHIGEIHAADKSEKRGPVCEECEIQFASDEAYKMHMLVSCKHNASNGCRHCGELFSSPEELKEHMIVHPKKQQVKKDVIELPTVCVYCAEYLSTLSEYETHMTRLHPDTDDARKLKGNELKPFVCETCGLAFRRQGALTRHQNRHTGVGSYDCIHCEETFRLASDLYLHKGTVHSHLYPANYLKLQQKGKGNYPCRMCGRVFPFKNGLYRHMRSHSDDLPHSCDICGKSFLYPSNLEQHIRGVHHGGWPKRNRREERKKRLLKNLNTK